MKDKKLIELITFKLEEYGMPEFRDRFPAMDILQTIKDAGYMRLEDIPAYIEKLKKSMDRGGL